MGMGMDGNMKFIHDDFLLGTRTSRRLFHQFAEPEPILDFHCHLSPLDIAENRQFNNLFEIWLEGDHYKWRAMRANGVAERFCTGDAEPFAKFQAWAATVPHTLRNPLYHWTHLELQRYFGIEELLDEESADVASFLAALRRRHDFFHAQGCRISDHGLNQCFADFCSEKIASRIFTRALAGEGVSPAEHGQFGAYMMLFFGRLDAEKGW